MIAKAKCISHGIALLEYITGESANKKHPEKILRVNTAFMPGYLDSLGMWESMKMTLAKFRLIKNSMIRIEASPAAEHTKDWKPEDWWQFENEFLRVFDNIELYGKNGKLISPKTNLLGSKRCSCAHFDSDGGVYHLHIAACRVDENGNTNNDHMIHERAQRAAEIIAQRRGWTTAAEKHEINVERINKDCYNILRTMNLWSWNDYVHALERKGYKVRTREDSNRKIHGYCILIGSSKYKASSLGKGRGLMYSRLQKTWEKMHEAESKNIESRKTAVRNTTTARPIDTTSREPDDTLITKPVFDYSHRFAGSRKMSLNLGGKEYTRYIQRRLSGCSTTSLTIVK